VSEVEKAVQKARKGGKEGGKRKSHAISEKKRKKEIRCSINWGKKSEKSRDANSSKKVSRKFGGRGKVSFRELHPRRRFRGGGG